MRGRAWLGTAAGIAPRILGGFFCAALIVFSSGCDRGGTPDWENTGSATQTISAPPPAPASKPRKPVAGGPGLRFVAYNIENWLTMDRYVDRKHLKDRPKPDSEKRAVIAILARNAPDVIGLCEVGTAADLAEIQAKLKAAGLDLPNSHYTGGADPDRHLGLLSRFPIVSTARAAETTYRINGRTFAINRGILDATVRSGGGDYRFVGVHLKSRRESRDGDQATIRLSEARLLRRHLDAIFRKDRDARLIVYGDFNDTRATPPVKLIAGKFNDPTYLTAIPAKDSTGAAWTHYWAINDVYSRFDFIMVSRSIKPEADFKTSHIIDDAEWNAASDHRPILVIFK